MFGPLPPRGEPPRQSQPASVQLLEFKDGQFRYGLEAVEKPTPEQVLTAVACTPSRSSRLTSSQVNVADVLKSFKTTAIHIFMFRACIGKLSIASLAEGSPV